MNEWKEVDYADAAVAHRGGQHEIQIGFTDEPASWCAIGKTHGFSSGYHYRIREKRRTITVTIPVPVHVFTMPSDFGGNGRLAIDFCSDDCFAAYRAINAAFSEARKP